MITIVSHAGVPPSTIGAQVHPQGLGTGALTSQPQ